MNKSLVPSNRPQVGPSENQGRKLSTRIQRLLQSYGVDSFTTREAQVVLENRSNLFELEALQLYLRHYIRSTGGMAITLPAILTGLVQKGERVHLDAPEGKIDLRKINYDLELSSENQDEDLIGQMLWENSIAQKDVIGSAGLIQPLLTAEELGLGLIPKILREKLIIFPKTVLESKAGNLSMLHLQWADDYFGGRWKVSGKSFSQRLNILSEIHKDTFIVPRLLSK